MCSISDIPIVGAAVNHISEATVGAASRGIRYVLYYKDNVDKLNSEINGLTIKEQEIEREVDRAKNNGKTIKEHVFKWQADAKTITGEVSEFLGKHQGRTSWRCFNVLRCPNPYRRFQLGRWAAKMTPTVCEFSDLEKKQLGGEISYFPPKEYSPISSSEYRDFGSREGAYKKILEALSYKEDGFPVVGIYGFGGVGKTRMMEEASKEVKAKGIFNTVARANVGQVVDIGKIQDELAPYLGITDKNIEDRASQLKKRLSKGDTILVILDDVWSEIPFAEIGIPFGDSNIKGCKILLTSRLQDVCIDNNCKDPVEIDALAEEEAWDMFTKTVGNSTIESVRESLAREVCHKCARLPLIIAAVGKALHNKRQDSWEDALYQLINCEPEKIQGIPPDAYACLRLSFNILHEDAYLCLLLCSLFGEDANIWIESLFRFATESGLLKGWKTLEEARSRVSAMVDVLKSSSLLLEGLFYNYVKLHDIIRDVARSMTAKDPEYAFLSESCHSLWPKVNDLSSRKLIYLDFKSDTVDFPDDLVCPELHTLYLSCRNFSGELPDNFFEAFPKLECLSLNFKSLSAMPSSIPKLNRLRCLTICSSREIDISSIIQLKNLEMLRLQDFSLRGLPLDLRQLRRLRLLDLLGCANIEIMRNVLSGLLYLEELYIPEACNILDEETKKKAPLSSVLSKLTLLTSLEIYFEDVKFCPEENFCKNLRRYSIAVGGNDKHRKHYKAIKSVRLCDDSIEGGVKTLVERGDEVILESVTGLQKCFSQGGGAFTDLKWLTIRKCMDAEYLFRIHQRVGSFSKLSTLEIVGSGFKYLFCTSTVRCLRQLEKLRIDDCKMMEEIVRNEGQIEEVNEIIDFPKLRSLRLNSLSVLKSFCGKKRNMQSTTTETASTPVHTLFDGTVTFPALRELRVDRLDDIHIIFSERGVFPVLEKLTIHNLDNLREIWEKQCPREKCVCPNLSRLSIGDCGSLRNVLAPSVARDLVHLEKLEIESCEMMKEIIGTIGEEISNNFVFPALKILRLKKLPMLNSFLCYGGESNIDQSQFFFCHKVTFPALRELLVDGLDDIRIIFSERGVFPVLEKLTIHNLDNLREIWEKQCPREKSVCPNLSRLSIGNCGSLRNVLAPSVARDLVHLENLEIESCEMMKEIIGTIGEEISNNFVFPALKILRLKKLPMLNSFLCYGGESNIDQSQFFFCHKVTFPALRELLVDGLDDIRIIFSERGVFPVLEKLTIHNLDNLREIWEKQCPREKSVCPNLSRLSIGNCGSLRNVLAPSVARDLVHLENLEIESCEMMKEIIGTIGEEISNNFGFPALKILRLKKLPMLNSFLCYGGESNIDQSQFFFCHKVTFPALRELLVDGLDDIRIIFSERGVFPVLEKLTIHNLDNLREIWEKQCPREKCVCPNLSRLSIGDCGSLRNVLAPSVARDLVHLEKLEIESCEMMKEIIGTIGEEISNNFVFPALKILRLKKLPMLNSFLCYGGESNIDQSQFFFCHKVVFPVLKTLVIIYLDNIRDIWEEQNLVLLPKLEGLCLSGLPKLMETGLNSSDIILYPNLKELHINECNNLRNVFLPSVANHYAKLLEVLHIRDCEMMNEIITSAEKDDKEICLNNIEFPMLKKLRLLRLPIMNSFWGHGIIESNLEQQQSSRARKVLFPSLEAIEYVGPPINLEEVINLGGVSTFRLRRLKVCSTDSQAPQFIPPNWLLASRDLEILSLENCWFHESDLFSLLGNSNPNYNGTAISFRRLCEVKVDSCRLSTIFPRSVAKTLQKLQILQVRSCGSIEEIVTDDERRNDHLVVGTCQEILFPELRTAELQNLPNLKSFCTSANCSFKMPSLKNVIIRNCPQMLSFTPQVRVTVTYPSLHGEQKYSVADFTTDVNNYLCQIMKTQELVDKEEVVKSNCEDKGKSVVIG